MSQLGRRRPSVQKEKNDRLILLENEKLKRRVESLEKENQNLKDSTSCLTNSNKQITLSNEKSHEKVVSHFEDLFEEAFCDLPDSIPDHSKSEVWIFFLKLFEKAYSQCQTVVLETFQKNIRSLTELQKEESKSGRCRKSLEESLALFQEAYSLLLKGSGLDKMNEPPDHGVMEKQLTAEAQKLLPRAPCTIIESRVSAAIRVAWDMLTLSPPAISCTPEKYTETWHEVFRKQWHDYKYYDLVYYRPVMLYGAGGTAAVRGLVGNKRSSDSDNCVNEGEGSSESDIDTDLSLCTPNQAEDYNTQANHTIISIEPELCNERPIAKSSISNPLLSQDEDVREAFPDCDTSVTTEGANRESHPVSMYELCASMKFSCSGEGKHHGEQVDICGICGKPIVYTVKDVFRDVNDVPFHFKCVLCPVCKQEIVYRETGRKAPTGEYWCKKCFDEHWICCVCKNQLSEAEMGIRLHCCGKNWRHEICQHGHD